MRYAVITEYNNHLTGGRYYAWMLALAMKEAGLNVTIYTNEQPTFTSYFRKFKHPKTIVIEGPSPELANIDVKADVYIGSPIYGSLAAMRNARRYGKPAYPIVFDPHPMLSKFVGQKYFRGWGELVTRMRGPGKIITLCSALHPYIYEWLQKAPEDLVPIYPCINSVAKARAHKPKREYYVVFVSRIVNTKKFDHVVWACRQNNVRLKVITSISGVNYKAIVKRYHMEEMTEFHFDASEEEKFELIRGAWAMINGAIFEGFGIWMAEAIACGTPVVCYDNPTLKEIAEYSKAENIYFARWGSHIKLSEQLFKCLQEHKFEGEKKMFDFPSMVKRVKEVFCTKEN